MMKKYCPREEAVVLASLKGRWNEELETHLKECDACAESILALRSLRRLGEESASRPDPDLLWWQSQLRSREAALRQVNLPIEWAQLAGSAALLPGLGWYLFESWPVTSSELFLLLAVSVAATTLCWFAAAET